MVAGFDIYGVGPLAHGAVGIELILGQNALQLLRKRVPGRKELNVIFFSGSVAVPQHKNAVEMKMIRISGI